MKKGVVLIIVMGVMLVLVTLAMYALRLMTQQSRLTEHQIKQMRLFYAAQAGVMQATNQLDENSTITNFTIGEGYEGYGGGIVVNITPTFNATLNMTVLNVTASY